MRLQPTKRTPQGRTRAISPIGKTWMNGSTLRVRFNGGTAAEQAKTREQAAWWTAVANLKFEFNNASEAEIRITFDPNDGAWSYIGTDCRGIPLNEATMNLGFLDGGRRSVITTARAAWASTRSKSVREASLLAR
jgi:hypothetical protein